MLHAARRYTIAHAVELLDFALPEIGDREHVIESIVCRLRRHHHCQSQVFELVWLACVIIDDRRAIWFQAGQEAIGRETHTPGERSPIP